MKNRLRRTALAVLTAAALVGPAAADEAPAAQVKAKKGVRGRYVRIDLPGPGRTLTLAEVQVFSDGVNVARQGKASQSSMAYDGVPERAIDGNTSGNYFDGGQSHTKEDETDPWWEVDLGAVRPIDAIVVWNRSEEDGRYAQRLAGFKVTVLDARRRPVWTKANNPAPAINVRFTPGGDPAGAARPFVRNWAFADLAGDLGRLAGGRSFRRGRELFAAASCVQCHRPGKEAGSIGPNLAEIKQKLADPAKKYTAADLLRDVLEPSRVISEKYRSWIITTTKGELVTGVILSQDGKKLTVAAGPLAQPVVLDADAIDTKEPARVSLMPQGLLTTLDREEVLDLLAYVASGGDPGAPAFAGRKE
jgi:putative heme-binding domain-containing protein